MNAHQVKVLLSHVEDSLDQTKLPNEFELTKLEKNIEYAQVCLLEARGADDPTTDFKHMMREIGDAQFRIAKARLHLEESFQEVSTRANAANNRMTTQASSGHTALATEEHVLQNHRETQESISDDLLNMAQTLRQSQQRFGEAIAADNDLIEQTGESLQRNSGSMKQTGGRLNKYSKQSSWSWVYTYLAILVAIIGFLITIGLIRIT